MSGEDSGTAHHNSPGPIPGHQDASIMGPTDLAREAQSPSRLAPPQTDHGALPTLKRCFADSYNRLEERGWARQASDPV
jgi:hypothetical protein